MSNIECKRSRLATLPASNAAVHGIVWRDEDAEHSAGLEIL